MESEQSASSSSCRIGFIGTGTIASAIITGLSTASPRLPIESIAISKRSESKSTKLVQEFPSLITVYDNNNQALIDQADFIFLTVLPQHTKSVLQELNFDPKRHVLISLVSTSQLHELAVDSKLPEQSIYKMICLPAVATHDGCCLLTPPIRMTNDGDDEEKKLPNAQVLRAFFQALGGLVEAETPHEMSVMMVTTGLMGSFYGLLKNNRDWLVQQGLPDDKATFLVGRQYHAMMVDAGERCSTIKSGDDALEELIQEQTPGGLNEQALSNLRQLKTFDLYNKVQDSMLDRILGKTDGSLPG